MLETSHPIGTESRGRKANEKMGLSPKPPYNDEEPKDKDEEEDIP